MHSWLLKKVLSIKVRFVKLMFMLLYVFTVTLNMESMWLVQVKVKGAVSLCLNRYDTEGVCTYSYCVRVPCTATRLLWARRHSPFNIFSRHVFRVDHKRIQSQNKKREFFFVVRLHQHCKNLLAMITDLWIFILNENFCK